jgi:hypothetical protein
MTPRNAAFHRNILMMAAVRYTQTSVSFCHNTWLLISEDCNIHVIVVKTQIFNFFAAFFIDSYISSEFITY